MYYVDYKDIKSVAEKLYCFMTIPTLTRPECTIWKDAGSPTIIVNTGIGFMSASEFCKKIKDANCVAISCVASTDKDDTRRVVLTYTPTLEFLILNFPQANGNLASEERRIVESLAAYNINPGSVMPSLS